jgi:hypothetical protein
MSKSDVYDFFRANPFKGFSRKELEQTFPICRSSLSNNLSGLVHDRLIVRDDNSRIPIYYYVEVLR